jgi:hypothetical protein
MTHATSDEKQKMGPVTNADTVDVSTAIEMYTTVSKAIDAKATADLTSRENALRAQGRLPKKRPRKGIVAVGSWLKRYRIVQKAEKGGGQPRGRQRERLKRKKGQMRGRRRGRWRGR